MNIKNAVVIIACGLLAGCGPEGEAKDAIKQLLNDPGSAQFTDMRAGKSSGDYCGYVNAKNRMGGFVGKTPFFYEKLTQTAAIVPFPTERDFLSMWRAIKSGISSDEFATISQQCRLLEKWPNVCGSPHPSGEQPLCTVMQKDGSKIYEELKLKFGD